LKSPDSARDFLEQIRRIEGLGGQCGNQDRRPSQSGDFISTGPRWHAVQEVHVAGDEALARLELGAGFAEEAASYTLYPSLLDAATGFVQFLREDNYLPLVYERLTVHAPIPAKIYSYGRFRSGVEEREVITCDLSILDERGCEAVAIKGFSMKRVAGTSQFQRLAEPSRNAGVNSHWAGETVGITSVQGAEALRRIVHGTVPRVCVLTRDVEEVLRAGESATQSQIAGQLALLNTVPGTHARPPVSSVYHEPTNELERRISAIWQRVLGIKQVGIHDNFFELGGTSLTGIQLVSEMKKELQAEIPIVSIFEASTVARLATYLRPSGAEEEAFQRIEDRAEKRKRAIGNQTRNIVRTGV